MGLSVYTYYETFKPHFSFRFKVDFLSNPSLYRLVQDIKLPSISINASDSRKRFGQTQFVLPFFEFGDQELEITFVETDTMKVLDYLTNNYNWPNLPNTEDIIVTEYDDTLRNVLKRTKYTITLFSYSAPQWQNSGSPSNMTITATYIVRSSRDITKDEYDLYNLPIYSPVVNMVQDMNVIGSSVDEGSAESEWQKFLGSLKDEETELEKNAELNRQRKEAGQKEMKVFTATETNTKAKEKEKSDKKQTGTIPQQAGGEKPKQNQKPLQKYTSSNKNRDADLAELRSRMQAAGVDTTNTSQVVDYLVKDGLITTRYKKDQNGLCATGTNLVAAVTSGATQIKSTGNGKDQNLSCYGYKKVASGKGANQLDDMLKHGQLKEGDVINISYSDGSKYGHAVTVYKDKNGKLAFASDYVQKSAHGQSNASRVGEFYIQRKA